MQKKELQNRLLKELEHSPYRSYVRRISLFGSELHETANAESDIDLLIEMYQPMSMLQFVHLERDLTHALGRNVDLSTPSSLSKYFRSDVLQEAEPLFESIA